jgi:uncharacterized lipoprotein NlpE involved in copper resistance
MNKRLQQIVTLCLVALLLSGVALTAAPTPALARSSAALPASANNISGTYVSNVYPAASAPGLVMLMSLYPNMNAEVVSFYFSNPPITELGTWEMTDDGKVAITLTENNEGKYDTPSTETFDVYDGMLVSGAFEFSLLDIVTPAEMEAADQAVQADNAAADAASDTAGADVAATETSTDTEDSAAGADMAATDAMTSTEEAAGDEAAGAEDAAADEQATADAATGGAAYEVFVTDVYPAADASGMVTLMALYPNMNMEQLTVYLGKDAIHEVGTWSDSNAGFVDVTITGSFDEEYETPVESSFAREGDLLSDGVFTFHQLTVMTPADMEAMMNPAGTYVSKLYPAADASGLLTVLSLFDNNNVEQVSIYVGKDTIVEQGTWTDNEDGTVTVSITGTAAETYAQPAETSYTYSRGTLTDGMFEFTRSEQVTPEQMDAATGAAGDTGGSEDSAPGETAAPVAVYKSDTLPAADSPGRVITLSLYEDGAAEMTTDFLNDAPLIVETGTWERPEDGKLTVTLTSSEDQGEYASPIVIGFDDADGMLTAVDYDQSLFGSEGLMLHEEKSE